MLISHLTKIIEQLPDGRAFHERTRVHPPGGDHFYTIAPFNPKSCHLSASYIQPSLSSPSSQLPSSLQDAGPSSAKIIDKQVAGRTPPSDRNGTQFPVLVIYFDVCPVHVQLSRSGTGRCCPATIWTFWARTHSIPALFVMGINLWMLWGNGDSQLGYKHNVIFYLDSSRIQKFSRLT